MDGSRSVVAGASLIAAFVAAALSLLVLLTPAPAAPPEPALVDLTLLITGQGGIGGPALSHLYEPQIMVIRRGDTVRLRVMNQSLFRHALEIQGVGAQTRALAGGEAQELTFTARSAGIFEYRCALPHDPATATCSPDHEAMVGHLVVIESARR